MSILTILVIIAVFGLILWAIGSIPMDDTVRKILRVVAIVALVLWVLQAFGLLPNVGNMRIH